MKSRRINIWHDGHPLQYLWPYNSSRRILIFPYERPNIARRGSSGEPPRFSSTYIIAASSAGLKGVLSFTREVLWGG
ncbi:hypothetical protein BDV09DRAFT_168520 [Aspergillus tetrazonus]